MESIDNPIHEGRHSKRTFLVFSLATLGLLGLNFAVLVHLSQRLDGLSEDITNRIIDAESADSGAVTEGDEIVLRTVSELEAFFQALGGTPEIPRFAQALTEVDDWPFALEDEERVRVIKGQQAQRLRTSVKLEVERLQKSALDKAAARDGLKDHAAAQRLLAFYPVSSYEPAMADDLRVLQDGQAAVANKLDALQRLHYNNWAVMQVGMALKYHDDHKSKNPLNDNLSLVEPIVKILAPIDPILLEPEAREFYGYTVTTIRNTLGTDIRPQFAERMTKRDTKRLGVDEF